MIGGRALLLLAFHFWKHILKKVSFLYDAGGERRFVSNYEPDHLLPFSGSVRAALPSWQGCTGCGLCDAAYGGGASVLAVVGAGVRDTSQLVAAARDAAALTDAEGLERAEAACPVGVPVRAVVAWVREAR